MYFCDSFKLKFQTKLFFISKFAHWIIDFLKVLPWSVGLQRAKFTSGFFQRWRKIHINQWKRKYSLYVITSRAINDTSCSRNKCLLSSSTIRLFFFQLLFSDNYVPVKWKLQHPLPWKLPGHLNFLKVLFKSPLPEPKSCSNAPNPWENYQITVLTFQ